MKPDSIITQIAGAAVMTIMTVVVLYVAMVQYQGGF